MRRFWMLLLAVMVLAAFLAVPAMATTEEGHLHGTCADGSACTACGQDHAEWIGLSKIDSITESGNYFVDTAEGVALEKSFEISTAGLKVTICLNGREWKGVTNTETPANTTRPLTVNSASTVNIVDCSDQTDGVSAGCVVGVDVTSRGAPNGGTLYVSAGAEVNMYNGTVVGGSAAKGGGLYITGDNTEVNFVGGVIQNGTAVSNGGNLYLNSGKFHMGTEGDTSVTSPAISGGSNTTTGQNGGSVYANAGTFKLMSGIVSGGTAANAGSNIYVAGSATLHMTGGKVCEPGKDGGNQNVFVVNGTVNMSGGEIVGNFSCTNSNDNNKTTVKISGSAKITGTGMVLGCVSPATKAPQIQVTAPLNEDAHIIVAKKSADTDTSENILIAATASDWRTYEAYIRGADPQITTTAADTVLTYEQEGIRLRGTADSQIWHCVCGANADEAHIGDCDGYDVEWEPWELTGSNSLPMGSSGHWYLVDADGEDDQQVEATLVNVNNPADAKEVYIDFNGVKVTRSSGLRFGYIVSTDAEKRHMHVFTDSSQDHTGGLIVDIQTGTSDHSNVWVRDNSTLICYRLNADFSTASVKNGSGFNISAATSELKLYECHVIGGTAALTSGSAVSNGGTTTIVGGTITGGTATTVGGAIYNSGRLEMTDVAITGGTAGTNGGAIYNSGTLTVTRGSITGGTADGTGTDDGGGTIYNTGTLTFTDVNITGGSTKNIGGAIYTKSTTVSITGGTITGGSASVSGGAIYNASNLTLSGVTIHGGNVGTSGGAIYTKTGTLLATGCTINGGTAEYTGVTTDNSNGGAFIITSGTATLDDTDITAADDTDLVARRGAALYVHAGTLTVRGGSVITGGKALEGGTVYMAGGTLNLYDGIICNGHAPDGGNVYMTGASTVLNAIPDPAGAAAGAVRKIQDGAAESDTDHACHARGGNIFVNSGTVNLDGATVSGGTATYDGAVYDSEGKIVNKYAYGGNIYMNNNTATIVNVENKSLITGGTVCSLNNSARSWAPGGNIYMTGYGELTVEDATITNGQGLAEADDDKVDGKNLYVNYNSVVNLEDGAVVSNTSAVNTQESILVQGGTLNIEEGASITTASGVTGYNIQTNHAAYSGNKASTPVINMSGGTISGGNNKTGGNVYLDYCAVLNMSGGIIKDGKATTESGGNVYLHYLSQLNMTGGAIQDGYGTKAGGNIYAIKLGATEDFVTSHNTKVDPDNAAEDLTARDLAPHVSISGTAKIVRGSGNTSGQNGGSIYMGDNTTLTVGGTAEIYGGTSKNGGGNLYSNGYVTVQDQARIYNGNASNRSWDNAFFVNADVELLGGEIHGGVSVDGQAVGSLKLSGAPVVDPALCTLSTKPTTGISVTYNKAADENSLPTSTLASFTVEDLTKDANVVLSVSYPATNVVLATSVDEASVLDGLHYLTSSYYIQKNDQSQLVLAAEADVTGVTVNGGGVVYDLADAIAKVGENDYITLVNSMADATISKSVQLDLNGKDLTNLTLADGVQLKLFDYSTVDYQVEEDENSPSGYSGYGIVTLSADNKGQILRQGNTPKATYGGNYRFVVLKEGDNYSAHRIYLAVKSTILYPNKAAVNYRTALRCDQMVAKYINAEGGGFGILASAGENNRDYSDYTENSISASSWDGENENNLITRLSGLLNKDNDITVNTTFATTKVKAQAYIYLADDFSQNKLASGTDFASKTANAALIAGEGLTSSGVNQSLRSMVQIAFAKDPATLDDVTKDALYNMYSTWSEGLMDTWSLRYLQDYKDIYESVDLRYGCVCGHPESTDNPCAENGHVQITWRPWDGSEGKFPSKSGNYYLTDDLKLTSQGEVGKDDFINLNTNGHNISVDGARRVANVYGVLNLTNFGVDGQAVDGSTVTATCLEAGNGGVLLILNDETKGEGNVSLYSGVTLAAQEDHNICYGVVEVGGDLNIYGGTVQGTTLNTSRLVNGSETNISSNGGAVNVTGDGYVYMNSGSIIGGQAKQGGAIYNKGLVELAGGTITGGTAEDGGMIYMADGTLLNNGVDLDASGCQAKRGAMMYLAGGDVAMAGTAEDKLTLTGGDVVAYIETDSSGNSTDDALDRSGSGGVFYAAGGTLDLDHCVLNSGDTKQVQLNETEVGEYTEDLDDHGGMAIFAAGSADVEVKNSTINGRLDADAPYQVCKRGGTIYMIGSATMDVKNTTITATYCNINGPILQMEGGTFTMDATTTLDSSALFCGEGALCSDGNTYGGNVSLANKNATFYMNGGTITGGVAKNVANYGGGNVSISSGKFYMYGGSITNGLRRGSTTGTGGGGNVRLAGSEAEFHMYGGEITGGVSENGCGGGVLFIDGILEISGTASISGNTDGTNANNIYLASGKTINLGKLESGAQIGVTLASQGGAITSGNTENNEAALENGWLASDKGLDTCYDSEFYIGRYQCECSTSGVTEHKDGCSGTTTLWMPWADTSHLPDEAGHWYLAYEGDAAVGAQAGFGENATANMEVFVDLNGKTVTRTDTSNNNRFFAIMASADYDHTLTICDTSSGGTGKLVCADEGTGQGLGIWNADAGSTVKLLGGTIDASASEATEYGGLALYLEEDTAAYMYGGSLIGGTTQKSGGAVYMVSGSSFTLEDGTITGGTTQESGGAVYMASNTTFTMNGGTILAGEALCTQTTNGTDTKESGGITYTYPKYKCSTHGKGGAVYIASGASFDMRGGTVTIPTKTEQELATYKGAGYGGLFFVSGTLDLRGDAVVTGGRANGAGNALGAQTVGRSDCGYGGNIFINAGSGVVNVTSADVTVSNGYAAAGVLADGTYTDPTTGEVKTLTDTGTAGGGLAGNICVSGTLNMTAGTVEGGEADTGGNIGTNNANSSINLGADGLAEKTVQILNGTAGNGGNLSINVRPCTQFVINDGVWIEGGHATENGGNIAITPWVLTNDQYEKTGDDADGNTVYATEYTATIAVNGGTITGGTTNGRGGNVYLYGRAYANSDNAYPKVYIYSVLELGADAVISNGAAGDSGNNVYLNSYSRADIAGTVRNTFSKGDQITVGEDTVTVSLNSVGVGTVTSALELTGSILNEKAAGAETQPVMRNLHANSGTTNINGTISGGYLTGTGEHGANLCVSTANANVTMTGGTISNGVVSGYTLYTEADQEADASHVAGTLKSASAGGNIYIQSGSMTISGGKVENGICKLAADTSSTTDEARSQISGSGGNIYLTSAGSLTLEGDAEVTGGKVARGGGNIYAYSGTLTIQGNAKVTDGVSTCSNGGNIFVCSGATAILAENATITGGRTYDGGGNIYLNGTFNMTGGTVSGGAGAVRWSSYTDIYDETSVQEPSSSDPGKNNANIFCVGSYNVHFSGGLVEGGVAFTNSSASPKPVKFSGTIRITGNGAYFNDNSAGEGQINEIDVSELRAGAEVGIRASTTTLGRLDEEKYTLNVVRLTADMEDIAYVSGLVKECDPDVCQVAYLTAEEASAQGFGTEGGIYLLNGTLYRYGCICGANEDESHLGTCVGTEVLWKAWTSTTLPTKPGNWFLYYTSLSTGTDGEEEVKYKTINTGSLQSDYYQDSNGEWHAVRALLVADAEGNFTQLADKSFQQATDANGAPVWLATDANSIVDVGEYQVVDSYDIKLDLNGYKLEGPTDNRSLTFYGRSKHTVTEAREEMAATLAGYSGVYTETEDGTEVRKFSTHRQAQVTYTIVDSSQGHTAVLATAGRFSGKARTSFTSPQGTNIWMYWMMDTLNTYRATIDASPSTHGWGMALTVEGTANLYDTTVIGGFAQGYFSKTETLTDSEGTEHQVDTLSGSAVGGGAIHISDTGVVNMFGGAIKDGTAIYRYMDGTNGIDSDRAIGGGNVFVIGQFHVKGNAEYPASITGGRALYYAEADGEVNTIPNSPTKQGGGVYLSGGIMSVEGDVSITGNSIGTVTAADEGAVLGTVVPTEVSDVVTNNLYLNGGTVTVKALTGTVGFTMNGTNWEGNFAEVDTGNTSYMGTNLIPDVAQTNTVTYEDGYLRYVAQVNTLQVGYGAASIYPTQNDIANGLTLGGYGNSSYSSSGEMMRMTRYWTNTAAESSIPATVYNRTLSTNESFIDMKATAMAFRDTEGDTVIIINVDYNNIGDDVGTKVKSLVSRATGVPVDNITISASHQHTGPGVDKVYWKDLEGNYTQARDLTQVTEGTYKELIYGNERLEAWEEVQVRTNYAETFYNGVRDAAVAAYNDLDDVVSISGGIMDTTTEGKQYNFVRNIALYNGIERTTVAGMITDNHRTTYSDNLYQKEYESDADVTMQMVKYERADKTIVLANFQSHPHLSDGSDNLNPNGGVVEIFRQNLSAAYGTAEKPCQVLYFSGAGGNVNSSTSITGNDTNGRDDRSLQPWFEGTTDLADTGTEPDKRAIRAKYHGEGLAALADSFLSTGSNLTVTVDPTTANVQVKVMDFEYSVWDETRSYPVGSTTIPATWSETKKTNAGYLIDWKNGGYLDRPGKFNDVAGNFVNATVNPNNLSYWHFFVDQYEGNDRIFSFFHANGVRKRYVRVQAGTTEGTFEIKAYDLGGIGFVAAPYEMFQENGQAIKGNVQSTLKASQPTKYANFPDYVTNGCGYIVSDGGEAKTSPYAITIIASQTTGAKGYIPSVIGYKNGGYATDTTLFAPGTGEQLVTAYVDMLIGLHNNTTEGE